MKGCRKSGKNKGDCIITTRIEKQKIKVETFFNDRQSSFFLTNHKFVQGSTQSLKSPYSESPYGLVKIIIIDDFVKLLTGIPL